MFSELLSRNQSFHRNDPKGYLRNTDYRPRSVVKAFPNWRLVQKDIAYHEYLDILLRCSAKLREKGADHCLADLEMTLFAQVIKLVRRLDRLNAAVN